MALFHRLLPDPQLLENDVHSVCTPESGLVINPDVKPGLSSGTVNKYQPGSRQFLGGIQKSRMPCIICLLFHCEDVESQKYSLKLAYQAFSTEA
jgi:hypothetical protein